VRIIQPEMKTTSYSSRRHGDPLIPPKGGSHGGISRRHFLAAAATAGAAGLAVSAHAFGSAATSVELTRHDAFVPGLPASLAGLRIAQVSDVHLPANAGAVRNALALLDAESPEIVILTGDIVERYEALDSLIAFASRARGTIGTYAVMGNWERSGRIPPILARRAYEAAGVEFLCNETAELAIGSARLGIVGLDDFVSGRPDAGEAIRRVTQADALVWALHAPAYADMIPRGTPASLLMAGHTHGGQIRLPLLPAIRPSGSGRFLEGWYDTPSAPLYVSRGVGTTNIRARFRCPAELPIFTLKQGQKSPGA
jgi:predicted MPP superfamily phosphohydrolase